MKTFCRGCVFVAFLFVVTTNAHGWSWRSSASSCPVKTSSVAQVDSTRDILVHLSSEKIEKMSKSDRTKLKRMIEEYNGMPQYDSNERKRKEKEIRDFVNKVGGGFFEGTLGGWLLWAVEMAI